MAQEYAIAPGFDNAAGLVVVTSIVEAGKPFAPVQGVGTLDNGEERFYIDGTTDDVGEATFSWLSTRMLWAHYEYLITDILVQDLVTGKRSGPVTARTRLTGSTYYNVNAILTLPKTSTLTRSFRYYLDVLWTYKYRGMAS